MNLTQVTRVIFYPFTHSYILDGETVLPGLTGLMKKHGLSANYDGISDEVLQHAAELGSQAHQTIEDYINGETVPQIPLIASFKKLGLNIIATEYLVTDYECVASSIDLVNQVDDTTVDLIDMKRTSSVHKEALAAQLGAYKYLFETLNPTIKVRGCYCLPIKKGNKDDILADKCGALVPIEPMGVEDVKAWFDAEKAGRIYEGGDEDAAKMQLADEFVGNHYPLMTAALTQLKALEDQMEEVKVVVDAAKTELYDFMLSHDIDSYEGFGLKITLKKPYISNKLDQKAFEKDHPGMLDEYKKPTEVKGSITIKLQ